MSIPTARNKRNSAPRAYSVTAASEVVVTHVGDPKPDLSAALAMLADTVASLRAGDKPVQVKAPRSIKQVVAHENVVCDNLDWSVIEPEHTARERDCQVTSPAQSAIGGAHVSNVEHYAPKSVTVLALPKLLCLTCTIEKACTHEHVNAEGEPTGNGFGACADCVDKGWVKHLDTKYAPVARVETDGVQSYTGRLARA